MDAPKFPPASKGVETETEPNQATHTNDETKNIENQLDSILFSLINNGKS